MRLSLLFLVTELSLLLTCTTNAFVSVLQERRTMSAARPSAPLNQALNDDESDASVSRRHFFVSSSAAALFGLSGMILSTQLQQPANAVGPVKLDLKPTKYSAVICPPSKPIPGEKAMVGMRVSRRCWCLLLRWLLSTSLD